MFSVCVKKKCLNHFLKTGRNGSKRVKIAKTYVETSKAFTKKLASPSVITILLKTFPSKLKSSALYVWEGFMGCKMHVIKMTKVCKGQSV